MNDSMRTSNDCFNLIAWWWHFVQSDDPFHDKKKLAGSSRKAADQDWHYRGVPSSRDISLLDKASNTDQALLLLETHHVLVPIYVDISYRFQSRNSS